MDVTDTCTLASGNIGPPATRCPRSLRQDRLRTLREWLAGGVLMVAIPLAGVGCLSTQELTNVQKEIGDINVQISTLEADDRDGTPLTEEERLQLQALYSQREYLLAYRNTFGTDTGPGQAASWISRLLAGDIRAVGEAVGAVVAAEAGRRVYKKRKANKSGGTPPPAPATDPTVRPIEPTPSTEAANGETLSELTAALLAATQPKSSTDKPKP